MKKYISILRGINVSGQKLIKMDALKKMYESMGFTDVKSYVQSGNIIFSAPESHAEVLEEKISIQIEKKFGFDVPVIVMNAQTLKTIIDSNPFAKDPGKDQAALYVTFLASEGKDFDKESIESAKQADEEIHFEKNSVYLYCPHGYGKTKLNNTFLERKLKRRATTRNWKTTNKLLELTGAAIK